MRDYSKVKEWLAIEIEERMNEMQLRPYHLSSLCKMSDDEVYRCMNGSCLPSLFSLVMLADRFECTVNDLLGYDEIEEVEVYEKYSASSMFFAESQYAVCLSDRMRQYLKDQSINFVELANKTGITAPTLRRWFAKTHPHLPTTEKFLQFCEALNCTPSELLGY